MTDEARHQARREQLDILSRALCSDPPQEGETPIALSALHVIVLMMSMADLLDRCEGEGGHRLDRACEQGMQLLLDGGESRAVAAAMLRQARETVLAQGSPAEPADPAVCRAWLSLLEDEVEYLRGLMRA